MNKRRYYPPIEVLKPITDKKVRAAPLQGRMQQGMLSFVVGTRWYEETKKELLRFPAGVHDDRVDSLAWCVELSLRYEAPRPPQRRKEKGWRDLLEEVAGKAGSHMAA